MAYCCYCKQRFEAESGVNVGVACEQCREAIERLPDGVRLHRCQCGKVMRMAESRVHCDACREKYRS